MEQSSVFGNHGVKPGTITKPFQLLATWLIGLILLVTTLMYGALRAIQINSTNPHWTIITISLTFSISAVLIIPVFLILIFKLQTKYRPEMQEDKYYTDYLIKKYERDMNMGNTISFNEMKKIKKKPALISKSKD